MFAVTRKLKSIFSIKLKDNKQEQKAKAKTKTKACLNTDGDQVEVGWIG